MGRANLGQTSAGHCARLLHTLWGSLEGKREMEAAAGGEQAPQWHCLIAQRLWWKRTSQGHATRCSLIAWWGKVAAQLRTPRESHAVPLPQ